MDNPEGYPHTHILNSNNLRILIDCKPKGPARQAYSQNDHSESIRNSHFSIYASPCPPYFVLRKARLDRELSESDSEFIDSL